MRQCEDHSGPVRAGSTWGPGRGQNGVLNGNPDRSPFHTAAEDRRGAEDGEKHQNYKSSDRDTVCGLRSDGYLRPLLTGDVRTVLCLAGGYILSVCAFLCLYHLYRLVERIGEGEVFTETNVRELNRIDMDVTAAAVITLIIGVTCVLMLIAVTAMAVLMALIIRVVRDAFSRAAAMKDELDYTI